MTFIYLLLCFIVSVLVLVVPYLIFAHGLEALDEAENRWVIQAAPGKSLIDKLKLYGIRCGLFTGRAMWHVFAMPVVLIVGILKHHFFWECLNTAMENKDSEPEMLIGYGSNGSTWYRDKLGYTYTYDKDE